MYIKQIKKILKVLDEQYDMDDSCKNNLCAAGKLLISIMKMIETNNVNVALPCLRNVYEMLLLSEFRSYDSNCISRNDSFLLSYIRI